MDYASPNSGRVNQPGGSLGTRAGGSSGWVPPGHGWKHHLETAGSSGSDPGPGPGSGGGASFQAGGHVNLSPGMEPINISDSSLVGLGPGKALLTMQAYDTSDYVDHVFMGWLLERSGSEVTVGPATLLDSDNSSEHWYQKSSRLTSLGGGYVAHAATVDDYVGAHMRHVRVRLLTTDPLAQVDFVDLPTMDFVRVAYIYPVTEELFVVAVDSETTVYLIERDGDTLSVVDTVSMEAGSWRQPLCAIVGQGAILVVWDERFESGSGVTDRPPTQVRPVAFSVDATGLAITQDHGPMGEFYPWAEEIENRVGFPTSNDHHYTHGTQVSDTTAAWAWTQIDYDSELSSPYPAPVATAWLTWDGTDVVVSSALVSEVSGEDQLAQASMRSVVPTGGDSYVVVADLLDDETWLVWVAGGQIVEEAQAFGGPEDWNSLTGAAVNRSDQVHGVGGDDFWILLQQWGANDPYLAFVAMDMG